MESTEEMTEVMDADEMKSEIFYRHFNYRHMPVAATVAFPPLPESSDATAVLRAYHWRLHKENPNLDHYHAGEEAE